jgi:hypothetical protein
VITFLKTSQNGFFFSSFCLSGDQDVVRCRSAFLLVLASVASLPLSGPHQSWNQSVSSILFFNETIIAFDNFDL